MMTETVVNVQDNNAPNSHGKQGDQGLSWIRINVDYFRTVPGVLKIVQLIIGIVCMALASPAYLGGTHFFLFVTTISFIGTLIWCFIYFLGVREALNFPINWPLTELLNTGICAIFYALAFIIQLAAWAPYGGYGKVSNIIAGVFGIFNTAAYAYGAYLLHLESRGNRT